MSLPYSKYKLSLILQHLGNVYYLLRVTVLGNGKRKRKQAVPITGLHSIWKELTHIKINGGGPRVGRRERKVLIAQGFRKSSMEEVTRPQPWRVSTNRAPISLCGLILYSSPSHNLCSDRTLLIPGPTFRPALSYPLVFWIPVLHAQNRFSFPISPHPFLPNEILQDPSAVSLPWWSLYWFHN